MTRSGSISEITGGFFAADISSRLFLSDPFGAEIVLTGLSMLVVDGMSLASIEVAVGAILRRGLLKCEAALPKVYT
jgi:hypothetical protein